MDEAAEAEEITGNAAAAPAGSLATYRPRKGRFNRSGEYVAISPIRLGSEHLIKPGEKLPPTLRLFTLKRLFVQNRIAEQGTPFAEYMVGSFEAREGAHPMNSTPVRPDSEEPEGIDPNELPPEPEAAISMWPAALSQFS